MRYKVVLEQSHEGFAVSVPGLPGCHSQGVTVSGALGDDAKRYQEREVTNAIEESRQ